MSKENNKKGTKRKANSLNENESNNKLDISLSDLIASKQKLDTKDNKIVKDTKKTPRKKYNVISSNTLVIYENGLYHTNYVCGALDDKTLAKEPYERSKAEKCYDCIKSKRAKQGCDKREKEKQDWIDSMKGVPISDNVVYVGTGKNYHKNKYCKRATDLILVNYDIVEAKGTKTECICFSTFSNQGKTEEEIKQNKRNKSNAHYHRRSDKITEKQRDTHHDRMAHPTDDYKDRKHESSQKTEARPERKLDKKIARQEHPEKQKAYTQTYKTKHPEKIKETQLIYENSEKGKETRQTYRDDNKDQILARHAIHRKTHIGRGTREYHLDNLINRINATPENKLSKHDIYTLSMGSCFYCGDLPKENKINSIDRVDNKQGYMWTNCISSCDPCNKMKKDKKLSDFIQCCINITVFNKCDTNLEKYKIDHTIPCNNSCDYARYIETAQNRGLPFKLTEAEFKNITKQKCHYCGRVNSLGVGVDRIDNDMGYLNSNVAPCCANCNNMKYVYSVQFFLDKCTKLTIKFGPYITTMSIIDAEISKKRDELPKLTYDFLKYDRIFAVSNDDGVYHNDNKCSKLIGSFKIMEKAELKDYKKCKDCVENYKKNIYDKIILDSKNYNENNADEDSIQVYFSELLRIHEDKECDLHMNMHSHIKLISVYLKTMPNNNRAISQCTCCGPDIIEYFS